MYEYPISCELPMGDESFPFISADCFRTQYASAHAPALHYYIPLPNPVNNDDNNIFSIHFANGSWTMLPNIHIASLITHGPKFTILLDHSLYHSSTTPYGETQAYHISMLQRYAHTSTSSSYTRGLPCSKDNGGYPNGARRH